MNSISIIIPVLNEAVCIADTLRYLSEQNRGGVKEIIVVDGGSTDATREVAAAAGAKVIKSAPGRAVQMNAGARMAQGDILYMPIPAPRLHFQQIFYRQRPKAEKWVVIAISLIAPIFC